MTLPRPGYGSSTTGSTAAADKHLGQVARGEDLVARRVHGLESDECLEVADHLIEGCVGSGLAGALDG